MWSTALTKCFNTKSNPSLFMKFCRYQRNGYFTKSKVNFSTSLERNIKWNLFRSTKSNSKLVKTFKIITVSLGLGSAMAFTAHYFTRQPLEFILPSSENENYRLQMAPPKPKIARSIHNPDDKSNLKITLYQFQTCPFCCKVRVFLDYYGFSYDVVEVNSVTFKEIPWSSYRKVPFLIIEQPDLNVVLQLKDSSMIVSALKSFLVNKQQPLEDLVKSYPIMEYKDSKGKKEKDIANLYSVMYGEEYKNYTDQFIKSEGKWRRWADKVYVHMISPNVYRTLQEAYESFLWFSEAGGWEKHFEKFDQFLVVYIGPVAMYIISKMLKYRHHLKDDVRESFYDETRIWMKEIKDRGGQFAGGNEPNLADLAVYGILMSSEGCAAFQDLLNNTKIEPWVQRMKKAIDNREGSKYLVQRGSNH